MLDKALLKTNTEELRQKLVNRGFSLTLFDEYLKLDKQANSLLRSIENLNAERNAVAKKISLAKTKDNASKIKELQSEGARLKQTVDAQEAKYNEIAKQVDEIAYVMPNLADDSVPVGKDEKSNLEIFKEGSKPSFKFSPKAHWDLAVTLDMVDFERAVKVTGTRFVTYKGMGAKLIRALRTFTLDTHTKKYTEIMPQVIVNEASFYGSGQFPKFKEDVFKLENSNYYLSSTSEVQLVNYHRDEIIEEKVLPKYYVASVTNYRSEAGSAGRDTRGVIRQHQFYKTELVKICLPQDSKSEHEKLTQDAENILKLLKLPFRRIVLCTGDMGFSALKTYDLEVWLPSYNDYKEISSCSNCGDFQARRAKIRYRDRVSKKTNFVHTLNGTGVSIDRLFAAVVENYQQADGTILVPKVLVPYMGVEVIK
ncbi:serine--tRNA ligase [[Mycoplasma] testudinis]|uniref:serine--tRNA ligase n=1 Tax=[Mycoplasma] testudinis TaxID=33924 RepID=UPI0004817718|nr:serine--tRNA ligase [[Mycoplasma] testudinis]